MKKKSPTPSKTPARKPDPTPATAPAKSPAKSPVKARTGSAPAVPAGKSPRKPAARKPKAPATAAAPVAAAGVPRIRLEVQLGDVRTAHVAGTFNAWTEGVLALSDLGNGRWGIDLELPPGEYEYLFIADGRWLPDPAAAAWVPNPFGGVNSVLRIAG